MKFVTKEEFEKALAIVELAVKNGQVRYGHHDNTTEVEAMFFDGEFDGPVPPNRVSFLSPYTAAQSKLLVVRNSLNKLRQEHEAKNKSIEELERQEQELMRLVPVLKE
jgi:hypothetical protein